MEATAPRYTKARCSSRRQFSPPILLLRQPLLVTVLNPFAVAVLTSNTVQFTVSNATSPSLISVSPEFTGQGADHVRMTLVGANFRPGATLVISPPLPAVNDSNGHTRA